MNPASIAWQQAAAFVLTVGIEWPLFAWYSGLGFKRTGWFCLLMNGATWFTMAGTLELWRPPIVWIEGAIIGVEAALIALFWGWTAGRALGGALLLNLSSWWGGALLLQWLIHFE